MADIRAPRAPVTATSPVLGRRALNRATLERQLLLDRSPMTVVEAVEHLVGLQAQTPHTWYTGLWSRLAGFEPEDAGALLTDRSLVRIALMRSTIHLVSAADCLELRPVMAPVSERGLSSNFGRNLVGVDRRELVAAGRALVEERPLTFGALGRLLAERWPGRDPASLAQAIRAWTPLVQVPPRGVWGKSGPIAHTTAESWLGAGLAAEPSPRRAVLRYLAAFGPATVKDVQTWSGLTRLREVVEGLRPELVTFRDEQGRELFDLPGAPRPDPDVPAPPRFLYDYDNLLLSHDDRGRVVTEEHRGQAYEPYGPVPQVVLVDGFTSGEWKITRAGGTAVLTIRPYVPLPNAQATALAEEGARLLGFAAADAPDHDVRLLPAG
ncbi:winged helix DNA-binding domain-containing protein [Sphaerisporangium corydalis]|uniref:Winged helix DNA-binding domain-containing protein n=1 Tax=Sphaerisporangium corydalis TaxID=1441875 RepID=A0ABV9EL47_9ACTN|nr:winged helix DNA-binding domain-containing protein [Sphaerisporangium corydalis]